MREFADELGAFESSKGTIRFTVEHPIPIPLVKKIVKARIQEERARRAKRR